MMRFSHRWRGLIVLAWVVMLGFAASVAVGATLDAAGGKAPQSVMEQQSRRFWQTVAAKPDDRPGLLKRYFSSGLRERKGEEDLLETFAMLAEGLGPDMAALAPVKVLVSDREGELHYTLIDGRRVSLTLTLTHHDPTRADPPLIDRFGVRPLPPEVDAVKPEQLPAAIAARIAAEFEADRFSGAVLVARGDQVIHAQAVGMADRKAARANTLDTPINLGSINKMLTAIAIAQLQAAGKLDWQDTVGKHLPNFPNAKIRDQVTIHQLLTHTSGVGSYWNDAHNARKYQIDTQQEFLETFVDQPLLFEPGQGLEYSNGGPVILGLIIEALSGSDYYDYVREHIYRPAGMVHADHFRRDDREAGFALGYVRTKEGQWQDNHDELSERGSAAGGGYASARDLYAFSRALMDGRLLTRAQLDTLWQVRVQPGPIGYGYLFSVGNTSGKRWVGHNGGAPGISAEFLHYPDDGLVIIVLANQDNAAMAMREWLHALVEASLFEHR
jgi:CubicO group peptidase (beta-lactamase class C family)